MYPLSCFLNVRVMLLSVFLTHVKMLINVMSGLSYKQKGKKEKKHKKKRDKKVKREKESSGGPVQISKFLKDKKKSDKYSMISGKKIKMKVKKTKKDKQRDKNRAELLEFLNSAF
uniref:Si:ch211-22i13.2 n=1 Tax=Lepisosteus oculatus TaxID=7918 RepID=W5NHT4_LEPOC